MAKLDLHTESTGVSTGRVQGLQLIQLRSHIELFAARDVRSGWQGIAQLEDPIVARDPARVCLVSQPG